MQNIEGRIVGEMEKPNWTEDKVRYLLPDVPVLIGTKEFLGKVRARNGEGAEVSLCLPVRGTRVSVMVTYGWSWGAIANALNEERPLTL